MRIRSIILLSSFLLGAGMVKGQITKGTHTGGVLLNLYSHNGMTEGSNEDWETKDFQFTVRPSYGYFIKDNIAIGLLGSYHTQRFQSTDSTDDIVSKHHSTGWTAGPFVRYYKFFGTEGKFAMYGELRGTYNSGRTRNENPAPVTNENRTGFSIGIKPGLTYMFHEKLGIDFSIGDIGYSRSEEEIISMDANGSITNTHTRDANSFSFNLNLLRPSLGVLFYLK